MKISILLIAPLVTFFNQCFLSQFTQIQDSITNIEHAKYCKEDIGEYMVKNVKYPKEAMTNKITGDVVIFFVITKDGNLDDLSILSSPDMSLSTSTIIAFNTPINDKWCPAKVNGIPIDKEYQIIISYMFQDLEFSSVDYEGKANKYYEKGKYEKALKFYTIAIKDDPYNAGLFRSRSKVKELLGDINGAKEDFEKSHELEDKILSLVLIVAYYTYK